MIKDFIALCALVLPSCQSITPWDSNIIEVLEAQCTGQFVESGAPVVIATSVCKCLIKKQQEIFPEKICMQAPQTLGICIQATTLFIEECIQKEKDKLPTQTPRERVRPSPVEEVTPNLGKPI
jgi:hypothetical protein